MDDLNRLVEVTYPGGDVEAFDYNQAGGRVESTVNGEVTTYRYDDAGRLSEATGPDGSVGFSWDDNGNLVATTAGDSYTWTSTKMMASAQVGPVSPDLHLRRRRRARGRRRRRLALGPLGWDAHPDR